ATLTCAAAASAAFGAPPSIGSTPVEVPVPAAIVAAHPGGHVLHAVRSEAVDPGTAQPIMARDGTDAAGDVSSSARRLAGSRRSLASGCWRQYFQYTDNSYAF